MRVKTGAGERMRTEIIQQPDAITATLAAGTDRIRALADQLRRHDICNVLLVARGTSDNAAMYGRYAFSVITHKITTMMPPSLLTVYDVPFEFANTFVLGISQSGESVSVLEFLEMARKRGALTCGLTNTMNSPIRDVADHVLVTYAREETSIPATKTYTTALAVLHQLATLWAGDLNRARQIYDVHKWMQAVLGQEAAVRQHAERYRYMNNCSVMGRGLSFASALETALKLAQCAQVVPSPYSGADFLHGPVAGIAPGFPCFVFAPNGKAMQSMAELLTTLQDRDAETFVVSNNPRLLHDATIGIHIPDMPEELAPMVEVLVGQLLSLHLALHKGIDPDAPPGVSKVTLTL